MNTGILKSAIYIVFIATTLSGLAAANIDDNLLLRYSFNEGRGSLAVDQTGYGFDAELHGNAVFADNSISGDGALFGNAIKLDGAGDYLAIESAFYKNRDRLNPGTIAISTWIKPVTAAETSNQYIVSKLDHIAQTGYALRIDATTGAPRGEVYLGGGNLVVVVGSTPITDGQWTHVAFIYDGQYLQLFVNGNLDATVAAGGTIATSTAKLMIGAPPTGSDVAWYNGQIDELRIYSALDPAGVAALRNAAGGEPGLLFYESFDTLEGLPTNSLRWALSNEDLVEGPLDNAFHIQNNGESSERLSFPAANNVNGEKGQISLWYRPDYGPDDADWHTIIGTDDEAAVGGVWLFRRGVSGVDKPQLRFRAHGAGTGGNYLISRGMEPAVAQSWQAGEWHHIEVIWDLTATPKYAAYVVDGEIADIKYTDFTLSAAITPAYLYIGSDNNGMPMAGAIDELKIYAEPQYNPILDTADKIRAFKSANARDGVQQPHETVYNSADAAFPGNELAAEDAISFYQTAPFERVYAGTVPDVADVSDTLSYRTARNNSESLFFNIYSQTDATDVTVTLSDLKTSGGASVVAASDMTLRVVKNWWQRTPTDDPRIAPFLGSQPHFPVWVPELLMYDDRVNFKHDDYDAGAQQSYAYNDLPSFPIPATAEVQTELPAFTSKQFMVGLTLPNTLTPGSYKLTATVTGAGISGSRSVILAITVDNIVLPEADKDFLIYHRAQYLGAPADPWTTYDFVSQQVYRAELRDIHAHGINGLTVYGNDPDYIADLTSSGFGAGDKLLFNYNESDPSASEALAEPLRTAFGEAWFMGKDEPSTVEEIRSQMAWAKRVHGFSVDGKLVDAKLASALYLQWADCLHDPHRERPDPNNNNAMTNFCPAPDDVTADADEHTDLENLSIYSPGPGQTYIADLLDGRVSKDSATQSYYWQSRTEDARVNRYFAGVHLYLTDLSGVFPYVYNHNNGSDPYDDLDDSFNGYGNIHDREMGLAYPTQEGPISTIQWEALREGIDDYRYLQLWKSLHASVSALDTAEAARSAEVIDSVLMPFRFGIESILQTNTTNKEFDAVRNTVANEILALQTGLELPDLLEATLTADISGENFQINDRVINSGNGLKAAGTSYVRYYLSTNSTYEGTDTLLCGRNIASLAKGVSDPPSGTTQTSCPITGPTAFGDYIIAVVDANEAVSEANEANNVTAEPVTFTAGPATLSGIDLLPTAFSTSKARNQVSITDRVKNQGNIASGDFKIVYFLSENTSYESGKDISLAANKFGKGVCARTISLAAGSSSQVTGKICYRPKVSKNLVTGTYYVLMVVDRVGVVSEYNETNNVAVSPSKVSW